MTVGTKHSQCAKKNLQGENWTSHKHGGWEKAERMCDCEETNKKEEKTKRKWK